MRGRGRSRLAAAFLAAPGHMAAYLCCSPQRRCVLPGRSGLVHSLWEGGMQ